jgi:hypothetical protein
MTTKTGRDVSFAAIEYRPSMSVENKAINMGVLIEFVTERAWVVGLAMRHHVDVDAYGTLDQLSKDIVDARNGVISGEIDAALLAARQPGDVLRRLAAQNIWSFHVGDLRTMRIEVSDGDRSSAEQLAEVFALRAYTKILAPSKTAEVKPAAPRLTRRADRGPQGRDIPPQWMLPTKTWKVPLSDSSSRATRAHHASHV